MVIRITSHRGDHSATLEPQVAEKIFNKLTGKCTQPLPSDIQVPDTFQELDALWNEGKLSYMPVTKEEDGEMTKVNEFNPNVEEMAFIAPITGG